MWMWPCAASPRRLALADASLWPIDHEGRRLIEEFPQDFFGSAWQRSFPQRIVHQPHPAVTNSLSDRKRRMTRPQARMSSLLNVSLGPAEPADQKISEALLGTWKIVRRVQGRQKVVLRDLSIEGGDQPCETFRANRGVNFEFLHSYQQAASGISLHYDLTSHLWMDRAIVGIRPRLRERVGEFFVRIHHLGLEYPLCADRRVRNVVAVGPRHRCPHWDRERLRNKTEIIDSYRCGLILFGHLLRRINTGGLYNNHQPQYECCR